MEAQAKNVNEIESRLVTPPLRERQEHLQATWGSAGEPQAPQKSRVLESGIEGRRAGRRPLAAITPRNLFGD